MPRGTSLPRLARDRLRDTCISKSDTLARKCGCFRELARSRKLGWTGAKTRLLETVLPILACPLDRSALVAAGGDALVCGEGHRFPLEQGVPVFAEHPRREAAPLNMPPCPKLPRDGASAQPIDAFVNDWIVNTNGNLYWRARGRLPRYPIPDWPFGRSHGGTLLDIGCSWGRWCIAAARAGFEPVGVDVHVNALAAAQRVSTQLGVTSTFACCDADVLPVQSRSIDCVFSYSVLQHIEKKKVRRVFGEIARVLKPRGRCVIQLPNTLGPLSIVQQLKRAFRDAKPGTFEMRYWSRQEIRESLGEAGLRDVQIHTDGFVSQNPQLADLDLLTPAGKLIVMASYAGRKASKAFPVLTRVADSLWIEAQVPSAAE